MAEQSVTLAPGESKEVAFEAVPSEAKKYQVSVNGLTGSFMATVVYSVEVTFTVKRQCAVEVGGVCVEWFSHEFISRLTVHNTGGAGNLTTKVEVWMVFTRDWGEYKIGDKYMLLTSKGYKAFFEKDEAHSYTIDYMTPTTGMPLEARVFIKVYDPNDKLITEQVFRAQ